jgi:hypothetical protein
MGERGVIRNREYGKQLRDFSGLRFEKGITPTDIDGFVEFGNRVFVLIETKFDGAVMSWGQRTALERLADAISRGGDKHAILIIATHNSAAEFDVDVGNCLVTEYRVRGLWKKPSGKITVKALIDMYREHCQLSTEGMKKGEHDARP